MNTIDQSADPMIFQTNPDAINGFIFAVSLTNIDLNGPVRYFDITFSLAQINNGAFLPKKEYPLVACDIKNWQIND